MSYLSRGTFAAIAGAAALGIVAASALSATAAEYPATNSSIGLSSTDAWTASGVGVASVISDNGGEVLSIDGGGGVTHNLATNAYPLLDNVLPAQLPWKNVFTGAVNAQIDPATGLALVPSAGMSVDAKVSAGAKLFVDATLAYGATAENLQTVVLTCELPATTNWSSINADRCFQTDNAGRPWQEVNWIVTEPWTYADDWGGTSSYTPGQYFTYSKGAPKVAFLSGLGFRVEGASASALIDNLRVRGQLIDFSAAATTSALTATTAGAAVPGATVTIRAAVSPAAVGSFVLKDGNVTIGQGVVVNGVFALTTSTLAVGTHELSAIFTPTDATNFSSSSATTTFAINEKKNVPVAPPAATTQDLLADPDLVVTAPSDFTPVPGAVNNPLDALDATKPLSGEVPWSAPSDSFVDVYAYSTPIFLGTFPVINGQLQLSGVDLSALAQGGHHLVFVGQTSGVVSAMEVTVLVAAPAVGAAATLAATGASAEMPLLFGALFVLAGASVMIANRFRRRATR